MNDIVKILNDFFAKLVFRYDWYVLKKLHLPKELFHIISMPPPVMRGDTAKRFCILHVLMQNVGASSYATLYFYCVPRPHFQTRTSLQFPVHHSAPTFVPVFFTKRDSMLIVVSVTPRVFNPSAMASAMFANNSSRNNFWNNARATILKPITQMPFLLCGASKTYTFTVL